MIYVEPSSEELALVSEEPKQLKDLMLTNSFGMPSRSPEFLLEDIDRANRSLGSGQAMIVSIVGTPNQGVSFLQDFVRAAELAKGAGAKFIEANLSCPNVGKAEGQLYTDPNAVYDFAHAIAKAIHPIPLILKTGVFPSEDSMQSALEAAARAGAKGISGINSVSYHVVDQNGKPALGEHRLTSGVCGAPIRSKAVEFLRTASSIIRKEKLDLELLGCGGVVLADHFDELLAAGAKIAMSATGMMWDPFLALRHHWKKAHDKSKTHSLPL
jgi:dihydroorotate dehydrogenase